MTLSFRRRRPVVDLNLCSVDMEHRQIKGHHWVRRCQLIHHISSKKNPNRHFPPRACSLPWYHIQPIHYRDDWQRRFNLHTLASLVFFMLWPAASTQCYQHRKHTMWHPCCRQGCLSACLGSEMKPSWCFFSPIHTDTEMHAIFNSVSMHQLFLCCRRICEICWFPVLLRDLRL